MNSTKPHAFPGYDKIALDLENAAHIYKHFSAAYCQVLLETAETYAQQAQTLEQRNQMMELLLVEIVAHLRLQPHFSKEARQSVIERAERILNNGPDGSN